MSVSMAAAMYQEDPFPVSVAPATCYKDSLCLFL